MRRRDTMAKSLIYLICVSFLSSCGIANKSSGEMVEETDSGIAELSDIKLRCSSFESEQWILAKLTDAELRGIKNVVRELLPQDEQVWFKSGQNKIGLCEFAYDARNEKSSCGSSYAIFEYVFDKWVLENESITICSSGRY